MKLFALLLTGCAPVLVWHGKSADRRVRVEVHEEQGWQWVEKNGQPDELTAKIIAFEELRLSPGGEHMAYPVSDGERWSVVYDGYLGDAFDSVAELTLSRDGRHFAYAAEKDGAWHVVRDGSLRGRWSAILAGTMRMSDDGELLAYAAQRDGSTYVSIDGREEGPYLGVAGLIMSGRHVAYAARTVGGVVVVSDGKSSAIHRAVKELAPGPSYFAEIDAGWVAIVGGVERQPAWESVSDLIVSGGRWAHAAKSGGKSYVVVDGEARPAKRLVARSLVVSPNRIGFIVHDGGQRRAVIDFEEGPLFDRIERIIFSGSRTAYLGERGGTTWLMLDGQPQVQEKIATNLVLSGSRAAYVAVGKKGGAIVVDGKRYAADVIFPETLAFDATAQHWGCVVGVASDAELYFLIDGRLRPLDLDEVTAALMQRRHADRDSLLAEWTIAELNAPAPRETSRDRERSR